MVKIDFKVQRSFGSPSKTSLINLSCECSSFVWNNKGVNVGMCHSVDLDGRPMCYLHQPNNCPDAQESLVFPNMEVSPSDVLGT